MNFPYVSSTLYASIALLGLSLASCSLAPPPARHDLSDVSNSAEHAPASSPSAANASDAPGSSSFFRDLLAERFARPSYPLDEVSRDAVRDKRKRLQCPDLAMETYRGTTMRYTKALKINPHFKGQLERFEQVVAEVATEVYGRAPHKVWHYGTYNCRTIRTRRYRLSEHALGNAIDVAGFHFKTLPRSKRKGLTHKSAGRAFKVSVLKHWDAEEGFGKLHARFLRGLARRLRQDDVFRGMIVPPAPGHKNHLHLDMGRWSYLRGDIAPPSHVGQEDSS